MATIVTNLQEERNQKGLVMQNLSKERKVVVRCVTNAQTAESVSVQGDKHVLHMLPASIVNSEVISILARGNVIDLKKLVIEVRKMRQLGVEITAKNLAISQDAYVIMPWHIQLEKLYEEMQDVSFPYKAVLGVQLCYEEKAKGKGIQVSDLFQEDVLLDKIDKLAAEYNKMLREYMEPVSVFETYVTYFNWAKLIRQFVCDTSKILFNVPEDSILLEGELLENVEVDKMLSPDSTSSCPMASLACTGAGYYPKDTLNSIGVIKPYLTKKVTGRFATEIFGKQKDILVTLGHEYRDLDCEALRCGWIELPRLSQVVRENQIDSLIITNLDVIGHLGEIKICMGYQFNDIFTFSLVSENSEYDPVYYTFQGGWNLTGEETTWEELPDRAKYFVLCISSFVGVPVSYVEINHEQGQLLKVSVKSSK